MQNFATLRLSLASVLAFILEVALWPFDAGAGERLVREVQIGPNGAASIDAGLLKPGAYDLGEVASGLRELTVSCKWRNDFGEDVTIKEVVEGCTCMTVTPSRMRVPAGESTDLAALFSLDRSGNAGLGFIVVFNEANVEPIEYRFDFYRPLEPTPSPSHLYFGAMAHKGTARRFVLEAIFDDTGKEFSIEQQPCSSQPAVICRHLTTKTSQMRQPDTLRLSFRHRAVFEAELLSDDLVGEFKGEIAVRVRSGARAFMVRVPFSGRAAPAIMARPDRILVVTPRSSQASEKMVKIKLSSRDDRRDLSDVVCSPTDRRIACELDRSSSSTKTGKVQPRVLNVVIDLTGRRSFDAAIRMQSGDDTLELPVHLRVADEHSGQSDAGNQVDPVGASAAE